MFETQKKKTKIGTSQTKMADKEGKEKDAKVWWWCVFVSVLQIKIGTGKIEDRQEPRRCQLNANFSFYCNAHS